MTKHPDAKTKAEPKRRSTNKLLKHDYDGTTDKLLTIHWSGRGDVAKRTQVWGGKIGSWGVTKLAPALYRIPQNITLETIEGALNDVLLPSDRAVLTYPHGNLKTGASAMRVRLYNIDVTS